MLIDIETLLMTKSFCKIVIDESIHKVNEYLDDETEDR